MHAFELPANIKQIGSIGDGLRIYMEDYVCTYLQQYAESGGYEERLALLLGRKLVIDSQQILFISGAVKGMYIKNESGISTFTAKSMAYAEEMIDSYFHGMEIVGWMQSQPSYGVFLNTVYAGYHMKTFPEAHQVLFVMDPIEKVNGFYTYGEDTSELTETRGYFIYYEKNKSMQEYMLANKVSDYDMQMKMMSEPAVKQVQWTEFAVKRDEPEAEDPPQEDGSPEAMVKSRQSMRTLRKTATEQKRVLNLLVSLSAVLFVICFIMGAGLIQNQDRISQLESQIVQLSTAYKNMMVDMRDNTASVFASQSDEDQAQQPMEASNSDQSAVLIEEDGNKNLQNSTVAQSDAAAAAVDITSTAEQPTETAQNNNAAPAEEPQPAASQPTGEAAPVIPDTYVVQQGDNLSYISLKFYGTKGMVDKIKEMNGISDDTIYYGKVIRLPPAQ